VLTTADLTSVFAILGDQATTGQVSWHQPDLQSAANWLSRRIDQENMHGFSMWAVETRQDGTVIGLCGFFPSDAEEIELGYVATAALWGQGYATEAAGAAVDAALSEGYQVYATIRPSNSRSLRVVHRAGLRPDGETGCPGGRDQDAEIIDERGPLLVYRTHPRDHPPEL